MKKIIIDAQKLRKIIRQHILEEQRIEPKKMVNKNKDVFLRILSH